MRTIGLFLLFSIVAFSAWSAEPVNLAELKSPDETTQIRTLWAIAQAGKASRATEADIVPLMAKSWEGRRLSKWCAHALIKLGIPIAKFRDSYVAAARWSAPTPEYKARQGKDAEWKANFDGPNLPEDLKAALPVVWNSALDVTFFGHGEDRTLDEYRHFFLALKAPSELIGPRLKDVLTNVKNTANHRRSAALTIGQSRCKHGVTDALILGLTDNNVMLRQQCADALGDIATNSDVFDSQTYEVSHPELQKAIAALIKAIQTDKDRNVRLRACYGLVILAMEDRSLVPKLVEFAKVEELRQGVVRNLPRARLTETIPFLLELANDPDPKKQTDGLNTLQQMQAFLPNRNKELFAAIPTIERIGNDAKDPLVKEASAKAVKTINKAQP